MNFYVKKKSFQICYPKKGRNNQCYIKRIPSGQNQSLERDLWQRKSLGKQAYNEGENLSLSLCVFRDCALCEEGSLWGKWWSEYLMKVYTCSIKWYEWSFHRQSWSWCFLILQTSQSTSSLAFTQTPKHEILAREKGRNRLCYLYTSHNESAEAFEPFSFSYCKTSCCYWN